MLGGGRETVMLMCLYLVVIVARNQQLHARLLLLSFSSKSGVYVLAKSLRLCPFDSLLVRIGSRDEVARCRAM